MSARKPNLIVIIGPTASGKSALAVRLAKKFGGEIVSADSRQVYRGLDIGTAKITAREMRGVPHHLLDIASPKRPMSAGEFQRRAADTINDIAARGKTPFLVGGTAFWIDAVVYGFRLPEAAPNPALRRRLAGKSAAALLALLKKLDPARAAAIEQKNPRRLIRAIEIASALGRVPELKKDMPCRALWLGLRPSYEIVSHNVARRVKTMIKKGLIAETIRLLSAGISKERIREFGFEYRAVLGHLERKLDRHELESRMIRDTLAFAKRQMAWWKRNRDIRWIKSQREAARLVKKFLPHSSSPRNA